MTNERRTAAVGDPVLDRMLGGGLPRDRAVLVTGGPGTGKSTLAMQYLQTGLAAGERCLFISTEQTFEELAESLAGYPFETDHEALSFASIHAGLGTTFEEGDGQLVLTPLDGEAEPLGMSEGYDAPFTAKYVKQALARYAPCDRVVLDSVSGLSALTEDPERFRRVVLDLIRFFADELDATTLLTAEDGPDDPLARALRFNAHGVIELERRLVAEDPHRLLRVTKLRGVAHDRRAVELELTPDGVRVGPARRSQPPALKSHRHTPIGIDGLDALCGGGLATGTGVLVEHDGDAHLTALFGRLFATAAETDRHLVVVPTLHLRPAGMRTVLESQGLDLDTMLDEDALTVLDVMGAWDASRENVYAVEDPTVVEHVAAAVRDRHDGDLLIVVNTDVLVTSFPPEQVRSLRYGLEAPLDAGDMFVGVLNPKVTDPQLAAFFRNTAEQVVRTWVADDGLQYVTLRKSPCGFVGTTSLVEYVHEPPYVRVQAPPGDRTNPMAEE